MEKSAQKLSPLLFFLFVWIIFSILNSFSITSIAAPYIMGELGASNTTASYTVSFFGIGNALTIPLALHLKKNLGPKKAIITCMLLFSIISFLAAVSPTYPVFIILRFLQGATSGPLFILIAAIIGQIATEKDKERFLTFVLLSFIIAPVVGAVWGGVIAYEYNWRFMFICESILLIITALFLLIKLPNLKNESKKTRFDGIGYFFYTLGVFSLGVFVILGQELDWFRSDLLIFTFIVALISIPFFILWSLRHPYPILNLSLLKQVDALFSLIQLAFLFSAYFGMILLLSLWLKFFINYSANWINIIIGTMLFTAFFVIYAIWRSKHKHSVVTLAIAILFLVVSCFYTSNFNSLVNFSRIAFSRILAGCGLALFLPPLLRLTMYKTKQEHKIEILSIFQLTRTLSSSFGAAFYTTLWERRAVFYHDRMGSLLTNFSERTQEFMKRAKLFNLNKMMSYEELNIILDRESESLALNDVFFLMGWILVFLLILLIPFYIYKKKRHIKKLFPSIFLKPKKVM